MSRGQSQSRIRSPRSALRRCDGGNNNNIDVVDLDVGKVDVIIDDSPEPSKCKCTAPNGTRKKHCQNVIYIDDDDDFGFRWVDQCASSSKTFNASSIYSYASEKFDNDDCQMVNDNGPVYCRCPKRVFGSISSECSTSADDTFEGSTSESEDFETEDVESDSSDCEMMGSSSANIREEWEKAALRKKKNYDDSVGNFASANKNRASGHQASIGSSLIGASSDTSTSTTQNKYEVPPKANTSANRSGDQSPAPDILNCSTEGSSFKRRRKDSAGLSDDAVGEGHTKNNAKSGNSQIEVSFDPNMRCSPCDQDVQLGSPVLPDLQYDLFCEIDCLNSMDDNNKEEASLSVVQSPGEPQCEETQRCENQSFVGIPCPSAKMPGLQTGSIGMVSQDESSFQQSQDACASSVGFNSFNERQNCMDGDGKATFQGPLPMELKSNAQNVNVALDINNDIMSGRERLKESEQYKRAEEEEWASRQRELQIQSEEAQRLRKRKKAETLRLLEMEKRQKQRLDEIRASEKKDMEATNFKEQIRTDIQKELKILETKHNDMASLLRSLGVNVGGGLYPLPHEVNAAYKQALLRFHPDRAPRTNLRQQVEAEEKFKMISRLKEKLLPAAY